MSRHLSFHPSPLPPILLGGNVNMLAGASGTGKAWSRPGPTPCVMAPRSTATCRAKISDVALVVDSDTVIGPRRRGAHVPPTDEVHS